MVELEALREIRVGPDWSFSSERLQEVLDALDRMPDDMQDFCIVPSDDLELVEFSIVTEATSLEEAMKSVTVRFLRIAHQVELPGTLVQVYVTDDENYCTWLSGGEALTVGDSTNSKRATFDAPLNVGRAEIMQVLDSVLSDEMGRARASEWALWRVSAQAIDPVAKAALETLILLELQNTDEAGTVPIEYLYGREDLIRIRQEITFAG